MYVKIFMSMIYKTKNYKEQIQILKTGVLAKFSVNMSKTFGLASHSGVPVITGTPPSMAIFRHLRQRHSYTLFFKDFDYKLPNFYYSKPRNEKNQDAINKKSSPT